MQCPWTGGKGRFYGETVKLSVPDREKRDNSRRIKGQTQVGPVSVLRGYLLTWLRRVGSVLRICKRKKERLLFSNRSLVGEGGFEPPKSVTTDLQSAPFGRSGIPPYEIVELVDGFEPPTC